MGNDADAKRYYNGAIYGVWDESADAVLRSRMDTHLELYRYLIDRGEKAEAQAELLATAAATPPDPALHAKVGQLILKTGQPKEALDEFQRALRIGPRNYEALAGAGEAEFQLGNDQEAARYLENSVREDAQEKRRAGSQPGDSATRKTEQAQVMQHLAIAEASLDTQERLLSTQRAAARQGGWGQLTGRVVQQVGLLAHVAGHRNPEAAVTWAPFDVLRVAQRHRPGRGQRKIGAHSPHLL